MSQASSANNNLDGLVAALTARMLAADNPADKALKVLDGEERTNVRPLPMKPKGKGKNAYLRAKAQKILELRVQGLSFDEIADYLDYKSGRHVKTAYERFMENFEREDIQSLRQLQSERLEFAYKSLVPGISKGIPRAIEVAMKVMERQARLEGLDVADQLVEKTTNQPIQINIMAHPADPRAKEMIIEHEPQRLLPVHTNNEP